MDLAVLQYTDTGDDNDDDVYSQLRLLPLRFGDRPAHLTVSAVTSCSLRRQRRPSHGQVPTTRPTAGMGSSVCPADKAFHLRHHARANWFNLAFDVAGRHVAFTTQMPPQPPTKA